MLGRPEVSKKVIWLSESTQSDRLQQIRSLVGSTHMPPHRVIVYERSWTAALPNMLTGLCMSQLFWLFALADYSGPTSLPQTPREWGQILGYVTGQSLPGLLIFAAVFARPAVDRRAQKTLRSLLART